jgi:exodeoxyribonuclease-3
MRIITLNICHGGGQRWVQLVALLMSLQPDVVVLTEFRLGRSGDLILTELAEAGMFEVASAARLPRQNSVCVVANRSFQRIQLPLVHGDEHRLLACDFGDVRLLATYFPQTKEKRRIFEFIRANGLQALGKRGLVIGDLNTGLHQQDEAGATFHCTEDFSALLAAGLVDAWRSRNLHVGEYSWYSSAGNGFRIDHAMCTPALDAEINAIFYAHQFRELNVTDHSALVVDLPSSGWG